MPPLSNFLTKAESAAAELRHTIVWGTVGDKMANGHCSRCGRKVTVATSPAGMREMVGEVVEQKCDSSGNLVPRANMDRKA